MSRCAIFLCPAAAVPASHPGSQTTPQTAALSPLDAHLQDLSARFWQWRATEQPFSNDDIPRLERSAGFVQHWSASDIAGYKSRLASLEREWRALSPPASAPVAEQVDFRLIGSAMARVHWELEVLPDWKRNPFFYVDQGLGGVFLTLLPPPPFSPLRQQDLVARLASISRLLEEGRKNLTDMRAPYVTVALNNLSGIETAMGRFREAVHTANILSPDHLAAFDAAETDATRALVQFREWLRPQLPQLKPDTAVGREGYLFFLRSVALLSYSPEQLLTTGQREFARAVSSESLQQASNTGIPDNPIYPSQQAQIADEAVQEVFIRGYMSSHGILSEPAGVRHYGYAPMPAYIAALSFMGVPDDLTSPSRLTENASSYKLPPRPGMPFFDAITARDTRPLSIHEGVPGHFYQLAWSWQHPDPIRRHVYDSQSNEGIGFYAEEMMLLGGLFDDRATSTAPNRPAGLAPLSGAKTKEAIYAMERLRALRVVVDVKLALGEFTLAQAADYLEHTVPMDHATAIDEASFFATTPGQAITYQIGKSDILQLLTDARAREGTAFRLQKFHDFVWLNGNVPFSLQRWELLGDPSAVPPIPPSFAWQQ